MSVLMQYVQEQVNPAPKHPTFKAGDNVTVHYKIIEGDKERIQLFRGDVIQIRGGAAAPNRMITVRKISGGVGVERIFPINSPNIDKIEVNKIGKVRRARLFYLRTATGKNMRIKEKRFTKKS